MDIFALIFILIYSLLLCSIVFFGFILQVNKENNYKIDYSLSNEENISLNDLVVIIPFRNEEKRLQGLLKSISNSSHLPKEIIFVDDHSSDNSEEVIKTSLSDVPYRILKLTNNLNGKKQAIRFAIKQSASKYILSMDADIEFHSGYFLSLTELAEADMYILPAILEAKKFHEYLYEVDLILVNSANCGLSGWKRPIMASGANLLYKRSAFENYDRFESHAHMPSGDDIYLLRDFRDAGADVRLITDTTFAIYTETPQSFKEFIHQRMRWIAKTGDVKDHLSSTLAIIQVILTFLFVALMILLAINGDWKQFTIIYLLKSCVDLFLFLPYFNRIKRLRAWLFIPIYEIIFPIYSLVILGMMFWFKPVWKGRRI